MNFVDEKIMKYCSEHSTEQQKVLQEIERQTYLKQINPRMLSGHLQGDFLKMITKLHKPEKILEIGTFTGYSAICIALALEKKSEFYTIEIDDELEDTIIANFEKANVSDIIKLIMGNAVEIISKKFKENKFDMVFIDADKENYPIYFNLLKNKINNGGLIIADNVLWSGKVLDENEIKNDIFTKAIHNFNEMLKNDKSFETVILPIRDGISLSIKK
ncbi:MAG: O-methyltransferase [Bacteroidetes bacterium]|nr:O-methyltransferase [Bacteroidota bacterium]